MEIISTGEKIKRSRIYKGITLKELCGDKISISKMSCIENGKIKPSEDILQYIADKLEVDYSYLAKDVEDQINDNLQSIKDSIDTEKYSEQAIKDNLLYAKEYRYHDLAFEFMHRLLNYYIDNNLTEEAQDLLPDYYQLYSKNSTDENTIIYYKDIANLFYLIGEYKEALSYFRRIRNLLEITDIKNKDLYVYICLKECEYYKQEKRIDEAYVMLTEAMKYADDIEDNINKGNVYSAFGALNIIKGNLETGEKYISKSKENLKDNTVDLAISEKNIAECYFYIKNNARAVEVINESINIFPKEDKRAYVEFLNDCIDLIYKYEQYDLACEISDISLDMAINIDEMELIEKAYYYKGMLLQKKGMYLQAEMYMNLSLDSLSKIEEDSEKKYRRYLDMAYMYYKLDEKRDSLKYFNLAISKEDEEL